MANPLTDEFLSTVTITPISTNGTVSAGATSVEFHPSPDFVGTIAGVAYTGAAWQVIGPFTAGPSKLLAAIAVTCSAGSINVIRVA